MKIHDKFVIELAEVIKGYGNDPTVHDPCKFPCDYKFYEIEGVAICEKSFEKMKRLEDEVNVVLDKIKTEIEEQVLESLSDGGDDWFAAEKVNECLEIIDKYRKEQEDNGFFDEIMDDESEDEETYEKIKEIIDKVKEQEE